MLNPNRTYRLSTAVFHPSFISLNRFFYNDFVTPITDMAQIKPRIALIVKN